MLQVSRLERNEAENNNLFHKGKYHCMADLLFDRFGFDKTSKSVVHSTKPKKRNPNKKTGGQTYSDTSPYEFH